MGLLSQGRPLDWEETRKYAKYVQERGIAQFINVYHESKERADGPFKWGDEVCLRVIDRGFYREIMLMTIAICSVSFQG